MSEFKPIDDQMQTTSQIKLRSSDSNEGDKPRLIPLNANANVGNSSAFPTTSAGTSSTIKKSPDRNGNPPGEHGATSMKKRSKRPAKPSAALLLAKQNALMKKRSPQTDVQIMITDHLQPVS